MFDVVIKNGLLVDGSGAPGVPGDIAIKGGKIAAMGKVDGEAKQVIDAKGRVVAPGFIDPHTHFDAQLLWDGAAKPALEHGVTSVVQGNCSLTLAPLKISDRDTLVGMFQQIEELPPEAFTEAFEWTWEDFAGYRAALEKKLQINVGPLVGHSPIRLWVMGAESQERAANQGEIKAMQDLLRECLDAGAIGLSTSFVDMDPKGRPVPSRFSDMRELDALCAVLGEYGRMLQIVPEFYDTDLTIARIDQLAELSLKHNIPTTFSPVFDSAQNKETVARQMARVEEQFARGARVWPQMQTRPIHASFSMGRRSLFFGRMPGWVKFLRLPKAERLAELRKPEVIDQLVKDAGEDGGAAMLSRLTIRGDGGVRPELVGRKVGDIAKETGEECARVVLRISVETELNAGFLSPLGGHDDTARIGKMLQHPLMHIGASDGGAHITSFATYGDTGYLFSEFVRKSGHFTMEQAVKKITADTADVWGLKERGRLKEGYAADIVVFDPDTIARGEEVAVWDMPGEGMRYSRAATGIDHVLVNGQVAYANGAYTDAKAGAIVAA